ncbi:hypothetical protein L21SP2_1029 [Salinispira pacifica]|uniref:Uncharacterized protein n=1 Tax=Salinispira pacifica TaxID=1307761 RepID=V5WFN2_9SPIO|nr:hypothetical protein L21SP2_1029 [Salinispira pacifica]
MVLSQITLKKHLSQAGYRQVLYQLTQFTECFRKRAGCASHQPAFFCIPE